MWANTTPLWYLVITTSTPPPGDPQDPPGGGRPERPPFHAPNVGMIAARDLEVIESNDDGMTATVSTDWAAAFFKLHDLLRIEGTDPALPEVFGLPAIAQAMAPGYLGAADSLDAIIAVADSVIAEDFSLELLTARNATAQLQAALFAMAAQFASGVIDSPGPYLFAASALRTLGDALLAESNGASRFVNVKRYLDEIADGMDVSADAVLTGLRTPLEQDTFLWGQVARFQPLCASVGLSLLSSEIVPLELADLPSWGPDTVSVHAVLYDPETNLVEDEFVDQLNEFGEFIHVNIGDDRPLRVWLKPETHLAIDVELTGDDGAVLRPIWTPNGDADGDNCIDEDDLALVKADQGEGGEFAEIVPSSDVSRNGIVGPEDIVIVKASLGECGAPQPGDPPIPRCPGDLNGDQMVNAADLGQLLAAWGPCPGCAADLNGDGVVNAADLGLMLAAWGPCNTP